MTISDYQISNVIRSYTMNMKAKSKVGEKEPVNGSGFKEDKVLISEEAKRILFERIGEHMAEKLKGHDEERQTVSNSYS
ncbi:MAG TPA: hypothetical protein PLX88_07000 [Syntrophorhabdaceae bacterium]|jgi:hypothetical protein|nr:hypothetical protein [Pseudomonadota bacterium]HOF58701.1 hypothetical protein [Syntrophorhabdaceae bacterium]HOS60418.1 hypothetical protein [Syntrophorhabdaceae bacterium]HPH42501.1 hypothetical protein [Syntrophorhabdaceae bacterium]HPL42127.1 hypothetical protein [Syntrophorhabdaceae bacterium]